MVRVISLVISMSALLCSPAFAGDQSKVREGVWNQTSWDQCRWAADSTKPKQATQTHKCNNKTHFSKAGKHYFVLGESKLGGGDLLAPAQSLDSDCKNAH
ncbi:MAG: hypothetical protein U0103_06145 [Candidatus Obscuribacterales bacterium]